MTKSELIHFLQDPDRLTREEVSDLYELSERYPYANALHILLLKALYQSNDLRFSSELRKRAVYVPSLKSLFFLLKKEEYGLWHADSSCVENISAPDFGNKKKANETFDMIDSLLQDDEESVSLVSSDEPLPVFQIPDYDLSQTEERTEEKSLSSKSQEKHNDSPSSEDISGGEASIYDTGDESEDLFTETLSKLYVKQGKYEQAKKIISALRLKYPEKNSYFAEQIKFLEKLIINQKA